jgi:hypothetical protein
MFDKHMVLTRGFQNVVENGQVAGFQLLIRITYYRGVFLSLVGGLDLTVDGEKFKPEQLKFVYKNQAYTMEQLGKAEKVHWDFGTPATLIVSKPGGLAPGIHDVHMVQSIKTGYVPAFIGRMRRLITLVA